MSEATGAPWRPGDRGDRASHWLTDEYPAALSAAGLISD